jgi:hypothetical protein
MFDTVAGKWERGPYRPKDESRHSWETQTREFFDSKSKTRVTTVSKTLHRSEARIAILGDGGLVYIEASLPKLLYGNNVRAVNDALPPMKLLREFVMDHVAGDVGPVDEMGCLRVDYCHNFYVGAALPDYVDTLRHISFLQSRFTYNEYGGVEWRGTNGRTVRIYDKYREILEKEEKDLPEARGILRFEVQIRKKSKYLQYRLGTTTLRMVDAVDPVLAYRCLVETLDKMALQSTFVRRDAAKTLLDATYGYRRSTRLLGLLRRLESEEIEDVKRASSRSTFYADKAALRHLGLWPPSSAPTDLPGLQLPPLEELRSDSVLTTAADL